MRFLLLLCLLSVVFISGIGAQPSDFLVLKKKDRTVKSYMADSYIEFVTVKGDGRAGRIVQVRNDSVFLQEYITRTVMTTMGFPITDTAGSIMQAYHYRDIYSLGKKQKGFNWGASGAALLGGGILLTLASGVVWVADRDNFSPGLMAAGAGLGLIGYFLSRGSSDRIVPGKKGYRLEYISIR